MSRRFLSRAMLAILMACVLCAFVQAQETASPKKDAAKSASNAPSDATKRTDVSSRPPEMPSPPPLGPEPVPSAFDQTKSVLGRSPGSVPTPSAGSVIRAITGFVALLALAYLGGTVAVRRLEKQLNFAHMITTGLPFVLAGLVAGLPQVGILTPPVLEEVNPLLPIGLGWIGFVVGARFNARGFERLPARIGNAALISTAIPLAMVFGALLWTIRTINPQSSSNEFIRNALLLATAGAMTARSAPEFLRALIPNGVSSRSLHHIIDVEQLAGVFGLMMLSAYYRPQASLVAWHLPGTGWLFVTLGIGTTMGIVAYTIFARIHSGPQFNAVLLGSIAFTAGSASYLRLSPLAVCFFAGAIAANLGGSWKQQVRDALERLERPVYFLFLIIAGALWHPWEWRVWALMGVFVVVRFVAKWISSEILLRVFARDLETGERNAITLAPMGALSVAIAVSAQDLYSGSTMPWIFTAVIGASLVNELILQVLVRKRRSQRLAAATLAPASSEVD